LLKLLRKHSYFLIDHPHLWFQSVINEGPPELASKATALLETRLPNVPYIKYLDREGLNGAVQARFYCSDTVACFDASPEMDYMVCECRDGTIHLWSLETGNKEWVRPSLVKRTYEVVYPDYTFNDRGAYRMINLNCLTFYRSVVFHPSGKFVLPGTLRSVYTLKGECNDLFPNSNCTFSHCAFARDKRIILTDCFDDPKKVVLWSMENGQELRIIPWNDVISSSAISQDGSQIAFGDVTGSIYSVDVSKWVGKCMFQSKNAVCGLMHFTPDNKNLVCGYLRYGSEKLELGRCNFGWVPNGKPFFILSSRPQLSKVRGLDFVLWPIEPRTLVRKNFFHEGFLAHWVNNVHSVFPSLHTGFYKKLSNETALVGGPSFDFIALVNVDSLNEVNSDSTRRDVVEKVVFSSEGDTIYSISSNEEEKSSGALVVTVFRMSSRKIVSKKVFTCPSLSTLVPMKDGVLLCLKYRAPELWNFELTECIRPIPTLKGTEKPIRLSDELIACEWRCRTLALEELLDCGSFSETENSMELHDEDVSVKQDESLHFVKSTDEDSSLLDDPSRPNVSVDLGGISLLFPVFHLMTHDFFRMLVVDIVNVASGERVRSMKARVPCDDCVLSISCNRQDQLLLCTIEEIDDDFFRMETEKLIVSLRNNNSLNPVWKRSTKRYGSLTFTPFFLFSPEEDFVVTWNSLDSGYGVLILDAKTGETLHTLLKGQDNLVDCKFVGNGESLVCCSEDNFLRWFNIRSGDLLSVLDIEERPHCLGACLEKPLVAIGLTGARLKFVYVKLSGVQEGKTGKS